MARAALGMSHHAGPSPPGPAPAPTQPRQTRRQRPDQQQRQSEERSSYVVLADRLNTYLADNDEYRTTLRHLLHLGGHITYTPKSITVALDPPTTPKITRALRLLLA